MKTIRRTLIGVAISALLPATALAGKVSNDTITTDVKTGYRTSKPERSAKKVIRELSKIFKNFQPAGGTATPCQGAPAPRDR